MSNHAKRIEIQEVIYYVEKCLGLDGVKVYETVDAYLVKKHKVVGRYMQPEDLAFLKDHFLDQVDVKTSNPLDIERYHRNIDLLINNGTRQIFRADVENCKRRQDPYVKTVKVGWR